MNNPSPQMPPTMHDQHQPEDERARSINMKWKIVATIYALAAVGLTIYWEFTDSGINMMVRDWQVAILEDSYYPFLDFAGAMIVLIIPLFIAKFIVEKITGVKIENPNYRR
jgi:hypothetical protein